MDSTKIDYKLIIDKYPNIVIASESEFLISEICESTVKFEREGKVVRDSIDRVIVTETLVINWEERRIVIPIDKTSARDSIFTNCVVQSEIDRHWNVPPIKCVVPLLEVSSSICQRRMISRC